MTQAIEDARPPRLHVVGGRVPPHNLDAEESLLGAMLLSRDAIAAALECCVAEDFYKPAHGHVFAAVTSLYALWRARRPGDRRRRVAALRVARRRGRRLGVDLAPGEHAVHGQRVALRPHRRGARARCDGSWWWPARSPSSGSAFPRTSPPWSTGPRPWCSKWPNAAWSTPWRRCGSSWRRASTTSRISSSGARPSPVCPPATGTSTTGWPACRSRTWSWWAPAPPWARRASPWALPNTPPCTRGFPCSCSRSR